MIDMLDTKKEVIALIVSKLSIDQGRITDQSTLQDLGADSLDIIELIMKIEDTFDIHIDDEHIEQLRTIQDLILYIHNLRINKA